MPAPPNKRDVELAKILFSQGKNKSRIARELNVSQRTIGRWLQYDDDPEFTEELAGIRKKYQFECMKLAWEVSMKALNVANGKLDDPKITAREAMTCFGIAFDKTHILETTGARRVEETQSVTFVFKVQDGNNGGPLPISDEVPRLTGEVPGDDRGPGFGENILALPGGNEDGP